MTKEQPGLALVTGASGGIGGAIALKLGEQGHHVIVHYQKNVASAHQVVEQIIAAGGRATAMQADLSEFTEAQSLITTASEQFGQLRVLINNAGMTRNVLVADMMDDDWLTVMRVNFGSTFNCTRAALGQLRGGGAIVNISSIMSQGGWRGSAAYSASKAAINAFTRSCAIEYARLGVRVNAILPGFVETELVSDLADQARGIQLQIPTRDVTTAREIADLVVHLTRSDASQLTGAVIPIDGGATAMLMLGHPGRSVARGQKLPLPIHS